MCAEAAKSTHLLAHTPFPNCTRPSALPPVHLGHTQIDTLSSTFPTQTRPTWAHTNSAHPTIFPAHNFNPPDHLPRTQIRAPSPTKIHHLPTQKLTHQPSSPHKFGHLP